MNITAPTPRVSGSMLSQNTGKKVLLVCKQESVNGNLMRVQAADGVAVTVLLKAGGAYDTEFLEFEGIVDNANTITEINHSNWGDTFDMASYNELCRLSNSEHRPLFI
mmetsp:Transcript_14346/g.19797  ORF Transcript_14346/g.19797 Transcript_14346/m.19797 type:complete len:108 (-) Transcript_14346:98-421(-)|eukprot:CAMPEP_0196581540 /NCGR_PEP_ID=MMETSP1081-20130531/34093_1 /TAXON_ID=36882 /ORGANISM="Pyramimonas amylifera, Strain CCMP720" /LENGTH=107 /DNA_ID=CAMNT_0041901803 /DNA_START=128 /DNA_END=451 /DNA_ORIENTATION=+